ncbi:fadA [Symbiodinium necroappetens]|jgi:acetyl-CoA C-acetyltransferase|uniref:FadA protein n=1 Tax=Symbiodinium necroappetens TaxID=1628268 RepID=A0A812XS90_9DINO|nr:acetyl-CoA C-acetyltransferase [Pseudomonadales bacterium]CAE7741253.1 fadA [Symbiodinium necroappetens]
MTEAWIIDAARTPRGIGKQGKGALWEIHPQKLLSTVLKALAERNNLNTAEIDDVIISCSSQIKKQGACIGRMSALDAGYSIKASGVTLDRFCGGGISAVNMAAASIMSGMEDLVVAGGVEMMSYTSAEGIPMPLDAGNVDLRNAHPQTNVGIAADIIATEEGFSRTELDAFSAESQRRAGAALESGAFSKSLTPVFRPDGTLALDNEEYPRPQTTAESLAGLEPVFGRFMDLPFFDSGLTFREMVAKKWSHLDIQHVHHAGSSSGVVDGAGALVLASPEYAKANGLKPRARIKAMANMGHSPEYILNAPVDAAKKVLGKAGMTLNDIDLFEVNEAFAVVPVKFMRDLDVDHAKLNVNGGAIALGHPIGATGSMLIGTALDELERRGDNTALITMCAAGGMAPAVIIERM